MKNTAAIKQPNPIDTKEKVGESNDKHIDQDFNGYPHSPSKENIINPVTKADRLTAQTEKPTKKDTSAKANDKKPGEPDSVEHVLGNALGGDGKVAGQPNQANKLRKEKNS